MIGISRYRFDATFTQIVEAPNFIGDDSEFNTYHRTILDRVHIAMVFHAMVTRMNAGN